VENAEALKLQNVKGKGKRGFVYNIASRHEHTSKVIRLVWAFSRDRTVLPAHPAFIC